MKKYRIFSALLVMVVCFSLLPVTALAEVVNDPAMGLYTAITSENVPTGTFIDVRQVQVGNDTPYGYPVSYDDSSEDTTPNGDNGGDQGDSQPDSGFADLKSDDYFAGSLPEDFSAVPFQFSGTTYYMGLANWSEDEASSFDGENMSGSMDSSSGEGNYVVNRCIGFWRSDGKAVSAEELTEITEEFSDLRIELKAANHISTKYPAIVGVDSPKGWPCSATYTFPRSACEGDWIFTVSGTIGGQTITAYAIQEIEVIGYKDFDATALPQNVDVVTAVNEWFADVLESGSYDDRNTYRVLLPSREITGVIEIPDGIKSAAVGPKDFNSTATLVGGINANGFLCGIYNINFIGAGKDKETWGQGPNEGKPNKGFYGTGFGQHDYCTFIGFDVALEQEAGVRTGGEGSQFINNRIGVLVSATRTGDGNNNLSGGYFENNDVAVQFLVNAGNVDMYNFDKTRFIDNGIDIVNESGTKFFLPGNYYEHNENTTDVVDKGTWKDGPVYICPVYTVYDNSTGQFSVLYWGKNATMSTADTSDYPIPAGELPDSLTIIDGADTENETSITFDFTTTSPVQTYARRMLRSVAPASEETFDATVEVVRTEDAITLTINTLPTGKTPTITVPCGDWYGATVTFGEDIVDSTYAGGAVSFMIGQGGTYVLTRVADPKPDPEPTPDPDPVLPPYIPEIPANPTVSTNTTTNADGSTTKTEIKADGTVTQTTTAADGTVAKTEIKTDGSSQTTVTATDGSKSTTTTTTTGATVATVTVSQTAVNEAAKADEPVALPMPEVAATTSAVTAPVVTITTGSAAPVTVEIPLANVSAGTVAVLVNPDGTETIIPNSIPTEEGLSVAVANGATLKIVDNAAKFEDVAASDWEKDAVDFVSARGIMNGTSTADGTFSPDSTTTRAQIWTMLARLSGVDTTKGENWYAAGQEWAKANGISDGTDPNGEITREQLATMLWRFNGQPAANQDLSSFGDHGETSDWAMTAKQWAVENGIINGINGSLKPTGDATRAQVAQMFMKMIVNG